MQRNGGYFQVLNDFARSKAFSLDPKTLPDETRPVYAAIRDGFVAIRKLDAEAAEARKKVDSDGDLTSEARDRRIGEIDEKLKTSTGAAAEKARAALEAFQVLVTEKVRSAQHRDPLELKTPDWSKLAGADAELARTNFAVAQRLDMLLRSQARDRVDRLLDRAFAEDATQSKTGQALERAYAAAVRQDDPVLLRELETYGRARVEAEGSNAQRTILATAMDQVLEERVGDEGRLLLDHNDALGTASELLNQTAMNPKFAAHAKPFLGDTLMGKGADA